MNFKLRKFLVMDATNRTTTTRLPRIDAHKRSTSGIHHLPPGDHRLLSLMP